MYIYPLSDVPVNRGRGQSVDSNLSTEDQIVFSGTQSYHPLRQPHSAPSSDLAQRHEGFARFLKEHSSPTHQRVTAGGRIVPMNPRQPPPAFSLTINNEAHEGVDPAVGPFATTRSGPAVMKTSGTVRRQDSVYPINKERVSKTSMNFPGPFNEQFGDVANSSEDQGVKNTTGEMTGVMDMSASRMHQQPTSQMMAPYVPVAGIYVPVTMQGQGLVDSISSMTAFSPILPNPVPYGGYSGDYGTFFLGGLQSQGDASLDPSQGIQRPFVQQEETAAMANASTLNHMPDQMTTGGFPFLGLNSQMNLGPFAQVPSAFTNASYPSPFALAPGAYYTSIPAGTQVTAAGNPAGTGLTDNDTQASRVQQGEPTPFDRAKGKFEMLTKHLRELDQFMAVHSTKLSSKVHQEKVRERMNLVVKRAEARELMKQFQQMLQSQCATSTAAMAQTQDDSTFGTSKHSSGTPLNVQAPPWTPKQNAQGQRSANGNNISPTMMVGQGDSSTLAGGASNQQGLSPHTNDDHSQISFQVTPTGAHGSVRDTFNTFYCTAPASGDSMYLQSNAARDWQDSATRGELTKDFYTPFIASHQMSESLDPVFSGVQNDSTQRSQKKRSSPSAEQQEVATDDSHAVALAQPTEEVQHPATFTWNNQNYYRLLDALRLPKGCITKVNIIGGAETMVHGQGLRQPPWGEMSDQERDYWMHNQDHFSYLAKATADAATLRQDVVDSSNIQDHPAASTLVHSTARNQSGLVAQDVGGTGVAGDNG